MTKHKLLKVFMSLCIMISCVVGMSTTAYAAEVTDVLTTETIWLSSQSYYDWDTEEYTDYYASDAVYAGNACTNNHYDYIQLKSSGSSSGIITTASGGKVRKIVVDWNEKEQSGDLMIYGNNSEYYSAADLYDSSTDGEYLGSITNGSTVAFSITDEYEYIGMRSSSGAIYLDSISITWENDSSGTYDVEEVTLGSTSAMIPVGKTMQLRAWVSPARADQTVIWSSRNESVAKVDAYGKVTAVGEGETYIDVTATNGTEDPEDDKKYSCFVTVVSAIPVTDVTLDQDEVEIAVGGFVQLTATIEPNTATNQYVKWSVEGMTDTVQLYASRNSVMAMAYNTPTECLTVYAKGISEGEATITCVSDADDTLQANCTVTVTPAQLSGSAFVRYEEDAITEGDYIITYGDDQYGDRAVKAEVYNNRLGYDEYTVEDDTISDPDASIIWHIAPAPTSDPEEEYWTIYNDNAGYAASNTQKNQAQLLDSAASSMALWKVSSNDGKYEFVNFYNSENGINANLRKNGTYGFACYGTQTGGPLTLYKAGVEPCTLEGASVTLNGKFTLNTAFILPDNAEPSDYTAVVTMKGNSTEYDLPAEATDGMYTISHDIRAVDSAETVSIQLKRGDDIVPLNDPDGEAYTDGTCTTSILDYCQTVLIKYPENANAKAAYTYAAYAARWYPYNDYDENAFDIHNGNVNFNDIGDTLKLGYKAFDVYKMTKEGEAGDITRIGLTLVLDSDTEMRLYFKGTVSGAAVDGKPVEVKDNNGFHYVAVSGIKAEDLKNIYTIALTGPEGDYILTVSPLTYVRTTFYNKDKNTTTPDLLNVVAALYQYATTVTA